ncbi:MAG: hypothetical protein MJ248_01495, partial [Bacilli bacterium]|nr:hypothetical protein [Bacilli bacterium]
MRTSLKCFLTAAMVFSLTSCGGKESAAKTYVLTFHQEGVTDTLVTVTKGETTNDDVKAQEPSITPKEGYTGSWDYDVTAYTTDTTISPTYTPITYYATYKANGRQVGDPLPFTVEDTRVPNEPAVPEVAGYEGSWNDYTIAAADMTITAKYEIKTYTATFLVAGEVIANVGFTINDLDLDNPYFPRSMMPEVPASALKAHYDVTWEDKLLDPIGDVTITLTEKLHEYKVQFVDEAGNQVGETQTYTYGQDKSVITEPTVPSKEGYTAAWGDYTLTGEEDVIVVSPTYTAITYYATFFADGVQVGEPVPFTVEDTELSNIPNVPEKPGYEGDWESYTLGAGDITINADYHLHRYYISFQVDGEEVAKVPYTVEDTKASITLPDLPEKSGCSSTGWSDFELTYSDEVLVVNASYYKNVTDFEDGVVPTSFKYNNIVTDKAISEIGGVEGSKCLDVSVKAGDFFFGFDKSYLKAMFANEWVKSVAFDAKSTVATENWRSGAPGGEVASNGSPQPFEAYSNGNAGLSLNWKTYYFTRAMYESLKDTDYMIKGAVGGVATISIDNVRPVDHDPYTSKSQFGFEGNTIAATAGATEFSVRNGNNYEGLKVAGAGVVADSWGYDYNIKSEGNRSVKFNKQSGYLSVYMNASIRDAIPGDYVLIDMYSTTGINSYSDNKGITDGMNNPFNRQTPGNKWFTLVLNKSTSITNDGRILTMSGSASGTIYFDNIRGASKLDEVETGYAFKAGDYGYYLDYKTDTTETAGNTIRDVNKNYTFMVNGANLVSAEVTTENTSTNSLRSVKFTYKAKGYCALFINPNLLNEFLPKGYTISFDLYVNGSFTGGTPWGNIANKCMGKWGTVTITEDMFEKNASG